MYERDGRESPVSASGACGSCFRSSEHRLVPQGAASLNDFWLARERSRLTPCGRRGRGPPARTMTGTLDDLRERHRWPQQPVCITAASICAAGASARSAGVPYAARPVECPSASAVRTSARASSSCCRSSRSGSECSCRCIAPARTSSGSTSTARRHCSIIVLHLLLSVDPDVHDPDRDQEHVPARRSREPDVGDLGPVVPAADHRLDVLRTQGAAVAERLLVEQGRAARLSVAVPRPFRCRPRSQRDDVVHERRLSAAGDPRERRSDPVEQGHDRGGRRPGDAGQRRRAPDGQPRYRLPRRGRGGRSAARHARRARRGAGDGPPRRGLPACCGQGHHPQAPRHVHRGRRHRPK